MIVDLFDYSFLLHPKLCHEGIVITQALAIHFPDGLQLQTIVVKMWSILYGSG